MCKLSPAEVTSDLVNEATIGRQRALSAAPPPRPPPPLPVGFGWWVSFGFIMCSLPFRIVFCNCVLMGFLIVFFVFRCGVLELFSHGYPYHLIMCFISISHVFLMFSLCFLCGFLLYFHSLSYLSLVLCTCAVCYGL